jgi:hypothetical protein
MISISHQISAILWCSRKAKCDGYGMWHVWERGGTGMVLSGNEEKEGYLEDQVIDRRLTVLK